MSHQQQALRIIDKGDFGISGRFRLHAVMSSDTHVCEHSQQQPLIQRQHSTLRTVRACVLLVWFRVSFFLKERGKTVEKAAKIYVFEFDVVSLSATEDCGMQQVPTAACGPGLRGSKHAHGVLTSKNSTCSLFRRSDLHMQTAASIE